MKDLRQFVPNFIPILLVFFLAACNPPAPTVQACTEIGCSDEVAVIVSGALPAAYTIDLAAAGLETISLTCTNGQSSEASIHECRPDGAVFRGLAPDEVTVTLTWEGGIVSDTVQPTYATTQPNGPDCPPTCRQGSLTLTLP